MAVAAETLQLESPLLEEREQPRSGERQLYDDTTTWLAEVLDGQMRTRFEYTFDGKELYGGDNTPLEPIFTGAIKAAEHLGANLGFEERRRRIEHEEYLEMIAMAAGKRPNTMVVVSDFPAELFDAQADVGGYNVARRQTMLRVISRQDDGALVMRSQSLDGSNRRALETMYKQLGFKVDDGELLGQRMQLDLPSAEQEFLIDSLTGIYDRSLTAMYGGDWYAGRSPARLLNTYDFVCQQQDLVQNFVSCKIQEPGQAESLRYGLAAAMVQRFKRPNGHHQPPLVQYMGTVPAVFAEMHLAANVAKAEGRTYSGCGISASAKKDGMLDTIDELLEAGLGNKTSPKENYKFDKKMHCVKCQAPPKKDEAKKMCGPCGICPACDVQLRKKK